MLHVFGALPLDASAEVEHIDREVNLGTRRIDHAYRVTHQGRSRIEHFEITTSYRHLDFEKLFDYPTLLEIKYALPVNTRIVLMTKRSMPARVPRKCLINLGGSTRRFHDVNLVRVWRLPASLALSLDRQSTWPWVMLMDSSVEEQKEAVRRVAGTGNRELISRLAMLCGLRYGKEGAWRIIESMDNLITREMMRESSVVQTWLEEGEEVGLEKGIEKGIEKGRRAEATRVLRLILAKRFQSIPAWVEDRLLSADPEQLEELVVLAATSTSLDDMFKGVLGSAS